MLQCGDYQSSRRHIIAREQCGGSPCNITTLRKTRPCNPTFCVNQGTLLSGKCVCKPGFHGSCCQYYRKWVKFPDPLTHNLTIHFGVLGTFILRFPYELHFHDDSISSRIDLQQIKELSIPTNLTSEYSRRTNDGLLKIEGCREVRVCQYLCVSQF